MGRVGFVLLLFLGAFAVLAVSADNSLPADKKNGGAYLQTFKDKLNKLIQKEKAKGEKPEEATKVVANDEEGSKAATMDLPSLLSDLFSLGSPTTTKPSTDKATEPQKEKEQAAEPQKEKKAEKKEKKKEEHKTPPKQGEQQPEYRWPPAPVEPVEDKQVAKNDGKKAEMADDDDSVELVIQSGHKLCAELNMTAVHALVDVSGAPQDPIAKAKLPSGGDDNKAVAAKSDHHPVVMEHLMVLTGTPSNCIMEEKEVGELKKVLKGVVKGSGSSRKLLKAPASHRRELKHSSTSNSKTSNSKTSNSKTSNSKTSNSKTSNSPSTSDDHRMLSKKSKKSKKKRHLLLALGATDRQLKHSSTTTSGDSGGISSESSDSFSQSGDSTSSTEGGYGGTPDYGGTPGYVPEYEGDYGVAPPSGGSGGTPYTECMRLLSASRRQLKSKCLRVLGPSEDRKLLMAPAAHRRELKRSSTSNSKTSNSKTSNSPSTSDDHKKSSKKSKKKKHLLRVLAAMDRPSAVDALKQLFGIVPDDLAKPDAGAMDDAEVDPKKAALPKIDSEAAGAKKGDGKAEKGEVPDEIINEFLDQPAGEQQKDVGGSGARPAEKLTKLTEQTEAPKDEATPEVKETEKKKETDKKKKKKEKKEKEGEKKVDKKKAHKKQKKVEGPVVEKCELFTLRRTRKGLVVDVDPVCAHATDGFDWNGISKLLDSMVLPPPQLPAAA